MLRVLATGPLALVQDLGRPGLSDLGVSPSGAADRGALRRANSAVSNPEDAATIEVLLGGLSVRAEGADHLIAVTGAPCPLRRDDADLTQRVIVLRAGSTLTLGSPASGLRSYLAVRGGLTVEPVLGSRSRDTLAGLGPEPLRAGDVLRVGASATGAASSVLGPEPPSRSLLTFWPGPHLGDLPPAVVGALGELTWRVAPSSDRVAVRLQATDGPFRAPRRAELASSGLLRGAVQLPPSGELVAFLADHPVTGGYPVLAVLDEPSCDRLAQLRPGERVRLAPHPRAAAALHSPAGGPMPAISKVLVANRGEIAVRVIRAARDAGLASVAVYADPDADALFVRLADEAFALGGATPGDSYLDQAKLLDTAMRAGADAIHPGYGFLAENAAFARAVLDAGLVWIGPPPEAIERLGDKVSARRLAQQVGAPLVPGTPDPVPGPDQARAFAEQHGLPIAIKAAHGGGGRGFRVARSLEEISPAFEAATREAVSAFGRGECFVERYLDSPRHVETQCLADSHGHVVVVSTRDCSLQRRHQKLVEEAPAPFLSDEQNATLVQASKDLLRAAGYVGAGTCEFLVGRDGTISFLEVNTRLQVEHPVSEEVSGLDLVHEQFRIAAGERLGYDDPVLRGHSIEFRLNAEDPATGFMPAPGTLTHWRAPSGPGVRVDEGYLAGMSVPGAFDSLVAKIIVTAATRDQALARARRALAETEVGGMPSVLGFHRAVLEDPAFTAAGSSFGVHTRWIETEFTADLQPFGQTAEPSAPAPRETVVVEVEGRRIEVRLPAGYGAPRRPAGRRRVAPSHRASHRPVDGEALTCPMQGTVIDVLVKDGDEVSAGDPIVVIEAMKMEQTIAAHRAGRISDLFVAAGAAVAAGETVCRIL